MYKALGTTPEEYLEAGIAALPSCYGQQMYECIEEENPASMPGCQAILDAYYKGDWDKIDAAQNNLPYCPQPPTGLDVASSHPIEVGAAAAIGLLLGLAIGAAI